MQTRRMPSGRVTIKGVSLLLSLIISLTLLPSLTGCSGNKAGVSAGLGEAFTIGVGQGARITGEDLLITFEEVIGDSRCPQNVTCIWAGEASANVTITNKGVDTTVTLKIPGLMEKDAAAFDSYSLAYSLNPYPRAGEAIAPGDYRLTLTVTK